MVNFINVYIYIKFNFLVFFWHNKILKSTGKNMVESGELGLNRVN